eukprot:symbB.v1.2.041505.t1/scaffold8295.1/size6923/2
MEKVLDHPQPPAELFEELEAHVSLVQRALMEWKGHLEVGMRQNELAKEQQVQEVGQLHFQLQEALAKVAASEAKLLQFKTENARSKLRTKTLEFANFT